MSAVIQENQNLVSKQTRHGGVQFKDGNKIGNRFAKGKSGNPGGRPKGLARLVQENTKDGKELVMIMLEIARGTLVVETSYTTVDGTEHTHERKPSHKDRIDAISWLADRGFGKSQETLTLQNPDGTNLEPIQIAVTGGIVPQSRLLN